MAGRQVAMRYAKALYALARDENRVEATRDGLATLRRLIGESRELRRFLEHAALDAREQREAIQAALGAWASPFLMRFLNFLIARRRLALLAEICAAYEDLYREAHGLLGAHVVSAVPLTDAQREALRAKIAARCRQTVEITADINPGLIGGFVVQVGDTIYDYSVSGKLEGLRATLANA